jgi:hypothetical protein
MRSNRLFSLNYRLFLNRIPFPKFPSTSFGVFFFKFLSASSLIKSQSRNNLKVELKKRTKYFRGNGCYNYTLFYFCFGWFNSKLHKQWMTYSILICSIIRVEISTGALLSKSFRLLLDVTYRFALFWCLFRTRIKWLTYFWGNKTWALHLVYSLMSIFPQAISQ